VLDALAGHGARVIVRGDQLKLIKPVGMDLPPSLIGAARAHRDELLALVEQHSPTIPPAPEIAWDCEDWQAFFDEAASVAEFDNGMSHRDAESFAFESCVTEWLNRNLKLLPPGRCAACCRGAQPDDALLPFGTKRNGHVWLHGRCWPRWHAARTAEAIAALARFGILSRNPLDEPGRES
jgi:hypothetical protein